MIEPGFYFEDLANRIRKEKLMPNLKDPKEAMAYLEAALIGTVNSITDPLGAEEYLKGLQDAVKNVIEANKEPEQYVWINVYEHENGQFEYFLHSNKSSCDESFGQRKENDLGRVGRLKVKLERRFDE